MSKDSAQLATLVGSRICHDLISPVGAIGNGLELMQMGGAPVDGAAQEMALIADSLHNAEARIRVFRVAFGATKPGQDMAEAEIRASLAGMRTGARHRVTWGPAGAVPRDQVRMAFLALMCLENALPYGGDRTAERDAQGGWAVTGSSPKLLFDEGLWATLSRPNADVAPSEVQFVLLPMVLADAGRRPRVVAGDGSVTIRF